MFPEAMNPMNIKKVSELWQDEKKYRWWIIGFILSLFTLFCLYLILTIFVYLFKNSLEEHFKIWAPESVQEKDRFSEDQFQGLAITSIGMTIAFLFCLSIFSYSVFISYKAKSFEKLDMISSFFLGFQVFFTFFALIQTFMFGSSFGIISGNTITILNFVLKFLLIPVWLLLSREIKKIKRTFFIAKRQEEIQIFYENNPNQMPPNQNSPFSQSLFGFPFQQNKNYQKKSAENPIDITDNVSPEINKKNERNIKLQKMTIFQLRKIADKLSISGNKEMNKQELIKIIISVSQSLEIVKENEKKILKTKKTKK